MERLAAPLLAGVRGPAAYASTWASPPASTVHEHDLDTF